MQKHATTIAKAEIGRFVCPKTRLLVPLKATQSLAFIHWPMKVLHCPACGRKHQIQLQDVEHPPVYGYE